MTRTIGVLALVLLSGIGLASMAQTQGGPGNGPGQLLDPWGIGPTTSESDEDSGILFGDGPGVLLYQPPREQGHGASPFLPPKGLGILPWKQDPRQGAGRK
ncbi:MAG: hypothetical protein KDC10_10755 [Calditrichaeota bacterium]|nr:hypothetical protein [Candidatus Cloacimonadota bacterium]MCB1047667.1 hypothetical protein [Calditrichota bacterium]MCB9474917.1 hypothetical protein [Candidatus Delongbacteria bacterium]